MSNIHDDHGTEDLNLLSRRITLGFFFYLVGVIFFVLANELWLSEPIADTLTAVIALLTLPVAAGIVWFIRFKQTPQKQQDVSAHIIQPKKTGKDPKNRFNQFEWGQKLLQGAHRYDAVHDDTADFINTMADKLIADGYYFAGTIDNPLQAIMEVYVSESKKGQESVFLIETDEFTLEQLMEHRYYFIDFLEELTQKKGLFWTQDICTVICARKMSASLKILLSYNRFGLIGCDCKTSKQMKYWSDAELAQSAQHGRNIKVVAFVEGEKRVYTGTNNQPVFNDKMTPWLKKYIYEPGYIEPEYVWKDMDWADLFYLDWLDGVVDGALCYDTAFSDRKEFIEHFTAALVADGYKTAGEIPNDLGLQMDVFVLEHETDHEAVLVLEAEALTMDMLHDHRYMYREFIKEYLADSEAQREKGFRIAVAVHELSAGLQALLIPWPVFPYGNAAFTCAYVGKEQKLYSMKAWQEDGFHQMNETWLESFLPETGQLQPETVWSDVAWSDIEGLPYTKNEINMMIRRALNVVRDPETLAEDMPKRGTLRWGRVRL